MIPPCGGGWEDLILKNQFKITKTKWYDNKCKPFIYLYEKKKVTAKYKGEISQPLLFGLNLSNK